MDHAAQHGGVPALIESGKVNVEMLITHRLPLNDFAEGAETLVTDPASALGVVLVP